MMLCSHDPIAQALEMQQAEEEQQKLSITEIMKNPSKVVLLKVMLICFPQCLHDVLYSPQNMVGPGEVDDDLQPEVTEECSKYGEVVKCLVYEVSKQFDWLL